MIVKLHFKDFLNIWDACKKEKLKLIKNILNQKPFIDKDIKKQKILGYELHIM